MALSTVTYTVPDPVETEYAIPFGFLRDGHISVEVNGTPTTGFTIASTKDTLDIASPTLLPDDLVTIARTTPLTPLVTFSDASTLRRSDLETMQLQLIYSLQEASDGSTSGLQLDLADSKWDAQGRILKDLDDPTAATDAATKGWVETAFATGGVLPVPSLSTALYFLRVNALGTGYTLSTSLQEEYLFRVKEQTSGPFGYASGGVGGWQLPAFSSGFSNSSQRAPLELVGSYNDLGLVSLDANTFDLTIGAGQWVIEVDWHLRGLTDTGNVNTTSGQFAITNNSGTALSNGTSALVNTGYAVQVQDSGATITKTGGTSAQVSLTYFANFGSTTTINIRGRASTSSHSVVVDFPSFIKVRRITR
jgi:hypothetical protein